MAIAGLSEPKARTALATTAVPLPSGADSFWHLP